MKEVLSKSPWIYVVLFIVVALIMTIYEVIKEVIFKGALTRGNHIQLQYL